MTSPQFNLWGHASLRYRHCSGIFIDCSCTRQLARWPSKLVNENREYRFPPPTINGLACKETNSRQSDFDNLILCFNASRLICVCTVRTKWKSSIYKYIFIFPFIILRLYEGHFSLCNHLNFPCNFHCDNDFALEFCFLFLQMWCNQTNNWRCKAQQLLIIGTYSFLQRRPLINYIQFHSWNSLSSEIVSTKHTYSFILSLVKPASEKYTVWKRIVGYSNLQANKKIRYWYITRYQDMCKYMYKQKQK